MPQRTSRQAGLENLKIAHGTPAFSARSDIFRNALNPLLERKIVTQWDCSLGLVYPEGESRSVPMGDMQLFRDQGNMCAELLEGSNLLLGSKIDRVSHKAGLGWEVEVAGHHGGGQLYDKVVVSSHTMGHARWKTLFGTADTPLEGLRASLPDHPAVARALDGLAAVETRPVYSLLLSFHADAAALAAAQAFPFDLAHVEAHPCVKKVVRLLPPPDATGAQFVSFVVHSTHAWAERQNLAAAGARSAIAGFVANDAQASADAAAMTGELAEAFHELARPWAPGIRSLAPAYGPQLHRWGAAFPQGDGFDPAHACVAELGLAFCGDFVAPPAGAGAARIGTVERAALSGIDAAQGLLATTGTSEGQREETSAAEGGGGGGGGGWGLNDVQQQPAPTPVGQRGAQGSAGIEGLVGSPNKAAAARAAAERLAGGGQQAKPTGSSRAQERRRMSEKYGFPG